MDSLRQRKLLFVALAELVVLILLGLGIILVTVFQGKAANAAGGSSVSAEAGKAVAGKNSGATAENAMATKLKQTAKQYNEVLDNLDKYDFENEGTKFEKSMWSDNYKTEYIYTLGDLNGDQIPDLYVERISNSEQGTLSMVRFFSSDGSSRPVLAPENALSVGVAGVGGYRGIVDFSADGKGVVEKTYSSMSGNGTEVLYRLKDGNLVEEQKRDFNAQDEAENSTKKQPTQWDILRTATIRIDNRAYLYFLEHGDLKTLNAELAKGWEDPEPTIPAKPRKK